MTGELDIVIVKNTTQNSPAAFTSAGNRLANAVVLPVANVKFEFEDSIVDTPIVNEVILKLDLKRVNVHFTLTGIIYNTGAFTNGETAKIDFEQKLTQDFIGGNGVTLFWPLRFQSDGVTAYGMPAIPTAPTSTEQDRYYFGSIQRVEIEQESGMGGAQDYAYHYTITLSTNSARRNVIQKGT